MILKKDEIHKIQHIDFRGNVMEIDGEELYFPLLLDDVIKLLGEPETIRYDSEEYGPNEYYIYHNHGLVFERNFCRPYHEKQIIDGINIYCGEKVIPQRYEEELPKQSCTAKITVNEGRDLNFQWNKEKTWKDEKFGTFSFIRWPKTQLENGPVSNITYPLSVCFAIPELPRVRANYKLKPLKEDVLEFDTFNFKLAIIQVLMYELKLLEPCFDIHDFADQYDGKEIDTDSEKPIRPAINWFKKLQIPKRLAEKVEEINMSGGDDVYMNIIPLWHGTDQYFDLKNVTVQELSQFKNLKTASLMCDSHTLETFISLNIESDYI
ncbi:DUF6892 domain-containing protein [Lysinibacillus sp. LZ02]|uniref:DUF6892 domain-containing protein n=1 Tax=Lysinibacillus sp. LZ02 TaxID=3420668 RepID=UPI003D35B965